MSRVTVKSQFTSASLGTYDSQTAALLAIANFIMMAFPPHMSIVIKRHGNNLTVYRVKMKGKRGKRQPFYSKEMEFTIG